MRDALLEFVLLLGPAIAVALAGAVLAYRVGRTRATPRRRLVFGALGAILRWGLVGCGTLVAVVFALNATVSNNQAPLALLAAPWVFALAGTFGLWRWRALQPQTSSALNPGGGE